MDLSRFSIDAALFSGAEASNAYRSIFYEKLLSGLFEKDESLFVRTDIQKEREQIFAFPAFYWLSRAGRGKALYLCFGEEAAAAACKAATLMAEGLGAMAKPLLLDAANADSDEARNAPLLFASAQAFHDLLGTGAFIPRDYGFVIADQAEQIAELPSELLRNLQGSLLPSWERKTLVIANRHTPRAKNFAWDFADNPKEIKLGETMGYAGTTSTISRDIKEADKLGFILKLLLDSENRHLCVFCNLKSMAGELSARLTMNGVAADYIAGNLNPDRKNQIVTKALTWNGQRREAAPDSGDADAPPAALSRFPADSFVLVLTDDGAKGLNRPEFLNVINYDIPLEPEFYFERLNFLKRQDPSALLYNLVCERYMYGIPAIERMVDASLSVSTLDPGIDLPKDLSAGRMIDVPEPRFRGRDDRHGRSESPRSAPARPAQVRSPQIRPAQVRPAPVDRGVPANPYAMSMEERLVSYRKKYGKRLDQAPAADRPRSGPGGGPKTDPKRKGRRGPQESRQHPPSAGTTVKLPASRLETMPGSPSQPGNQPQTGQIAPAGGEKPRGIFGRLQDFFGTHKE